MSEESSASVGGDDVGARSTALVCSFASLVTLRSISNTFSRIGVVGAVEGPLGGNVDTEVSLGSGDTFDIRFELRHDLRLLLVVLSTRLRASGLTRLSILLRTDDLRDLGGGVVTLRTVESEEGELEGPGR